MLFCRHGTFIYQKGQILTFYESRQLGETFQFVAHSKYRTPERCLIAEEQLTINFFFLINLTELEFLMQFSMIFKVLHCKSLLDHFLILLYSIYQIYELDNWFDMPYWTFSHSKKTPFNELFNSHVTLNFSSYSLKKKIYKMLWNHIPIKLAPYICVNVCLISHTYVRRTLADCGRPQHNAALMNAQSKKVVWYLTTTV